MAKGRDAMAKGRDGIVEGQARRLWAGGSVAGLAEGQVLGRFAADGDPAAFEALVERHGSMVLGVCRRYLPNPCIRGLYEYEHPGGWAAYRREKKEEDRQEKELLARSPWRRLEKRIDRLAHEAGI